MSQDSFFEIKPRKQKIEKEEIDLEQVSWKDIKPAKTYQNIKKQYFLNKQQEKKRKFSEYQKQNRSTSQRKASQTSPSPMKKFKKSSFETSFSMPSIQQIQSSFNNQSQKEEKKEESKNNQALQFLEEVFATLDRPSFNIYKESMKKLKSGLFTSIDLFAQDVLSSFFKSSLGVALEEDKRLLNTISIPEQENYDKLKKLVLETANYIPRNQRERYLYVIRMYTDKYEKMYPISKLNGSQQQSRAVKKEQQQQIIQKVLSKEQHKEELEEEQESNEIVRCCICYETSNLYVSKCKHVACFNCWNQWLDKTLECPTCRRRTRKNQIFPMNKEDEKEIKENIRSQSQGRQTPSSSQQTKKY